MRSRSNGRHRASVYYYNGKTGRRLIIITPGQMRVRWKINAAKRCPSEGGESRVGLVQSPVFVVVGNRVRGNVGRDRWRETHAALREIGREIVFRLVFFRNGI